MRPALVPKHSRRRGFSVLAVLLASLSLAPTSASGTTFPLTISPNHGPAGATVDLSASGLSPGGFTWSVYWDGVLADTFTMPPGDSFTHPFVIPANATLTWHSIKVCISCGDVEFEWSGSTYYTVTSTGGTGGDFDAQILTIELTQGVRGDLEVRDVPLGGPVIPDDGTVHVMNRRTVVRVYPWIDLDPGATSQPLTCELRGYRDGVELPGSPLQPLNLRVSEIDESWTLLSMRNDPARSWNFVLPEPWVRQSSVPGEVDDSIHLDLLARVNPDGPLHVPERSGAHIDNVAQLIDQEFVHVTGARSFPFRFFPILVEYTDTSDPNAPLYNPPPSMGSVIASFHTAATLLPVPAGSNSRSNMLILPPRSESYTGHFRTEAANRKFRRQMVRRYFPSGDFDRPDRGDYYLFLFDGTNNCSGHAYLKSAFVKSSACGVVFTHELTHAIGQSHAGNGHGEGGGGGYDHDYPGSHGQVESDTFGFDVYAMTVTPPLAPDAPQGVTHDFMSYGGAPNWTSRYQWGRVAEHLDAPEISTKTNPVALPRTMGPWLLLSGRADVAGCELDAVFETIEPEPVSSPSLTPYALRFENSAGSVVLEHPLADDMAQDLQGEPGYDFIAVASPPSDWASVVVVENGVVLEERFRSPNPPSVTLLTPVDGDQWPATGSVNASWIASDADLETLTFRLEGSPDGGKWFALANETTDSQVAVDMTQIPVGAGPLWVRVQASDGLNVVVSDPVVVTLKPRPPFAYLVQPADESTYLEGQPIPLFGLASDWQDGDLDGANLSWLVDGSWVANGNAHELTGLSPGAHTVELIAYNNLQLAGQMTAKIKVVSALSAPTLQVPPSGSDGVPTQTDFGWDEVPGANGYRLQVALDGQFAQLVLDYGAVLETTFRLGGLDPEATYYWRVRPQSAIDLGPWSNQAWFTTGIATAVDSPSTLGPWGFRLDPPNPNPFNPRTKVQFMLSHAAHVTLDVFDLRGRRVRRLASGNMTAGTHRVTWEGIDLEGKTVASGTYFVRLDVQGHGTEIRKVALLR